MSAMRTAVAVLLAVAVVLGGSVAAGATTDSPAPAAPPPPAAPVASPVDALVWAEVARIDALTAGSASTITWELVEDTPTGDVALTYMAKGRVILSRARLAALNDPGAVAAVVRHEYGHMAVWWTDPNMAAFTDACDLRDPGEYREHEVAADAVAAILAHLEGVLHRPAYVSDLSRSSLDEATRMMDQLTPGPGLTG